jgi:hypothetical protein
MATKPTKTSSVKAKTAKTEKTTAPKVSRARKSDVVRDDVVRDDAQMMQSGAARTPAHEDIAMRAYARFEARGFQHGYDVEDWLAAERELMQAH